MLPVFPVLPDFCATFSARSCASSGSISASPPPCAPVGSVENSFDVMCEYLSTCFISFCGRSRVRSGEFASRSIERAGSLSWSGTPSGSRRYVRASARPCESLGRVDRSAFCARRVESVPSMSNGRFRAARSVAVTCFAPGTYPSARIISMRGALLSSVPLGLTQHRPFFRRSAASADAALDRGARAAFALRCPFPPPR